MKKLYVLAMALSYLALYGCGQSGPLYLPAKNVPPVQAPGAENQSSNHE